MPPAVPLVVTLHELEEERGGMQLAASAAAVVCTGQEAAAVVRRRLPGTPVRVVPIGPNVAVTSDGTRNWSGGPLAVFFGFVHPVKGIPYLLDALLVVRVRHPDLRLAIVGGFESLALPEEEAASYRDEVEEDRKSVV
jgi:glycosyltransferase involved in cell wall biosynthesis